MICGIVPDTVGIRQEAGHDGAVADSSRWSAEFRLLGAVDVVRDGRALPPLPAQPACVLAVLLLGVGDVVSVDRLVDAVWGERPPDGARNALQVYVSRLRRLLTGAEGAHIETVGRHGYRLVAPPDSVDLLRFRRLAKDGDLDAALALWRGEPFDGVAGDWLSRQVAPTLREERLLALEARAAGYARNGRPGDAVVELTALLAEHPTRQGLAAELMRALHGAGRTAEALDVYRDLRATLVDELGLEPNEPVRELHEAILAGADLSEAPPRTVPAQLPAGVATFVGRASVANEVVTALTEVPALVVLSGAGGTGKSTLAVHAAHQARSAFPDGQLYAALGPAAPAEVLADFLVALGVPAAQVPLTIEQRAALYRSMLADRRVLVVLDAVPGPGQLRPLLPGAAGCAVLATSRSRLGSVEATRRVEVGGLPESESVRLLAAVLGADRVDAEPDAARALAAGCGYLPLALRIAAGRLSNRPQWRLGTLADRLADQRARLDELHLDDLDVRATFVLSYQQLDPEAARAFRMWSLADSEWLTEASAAAVLGVDRRGVDAAVEALLDVHLLEPAGGDRLRQHGLLRELGRELADTADPPAQRAAAQERLAGWYAHTAAAALTTAVPGIRPPRLLLPSGAGAPGFDDEAAALGWLDAERANLVAVLRAAAARRQVPPPDLAWLAGNVGRYAAPRGYLDGWRDLVQAAVDAARTFGDRRSEARAMIALGAVDHRSYELDAAAEHLGWAAGEVLGSGEATEATALRNLAHVHAALQRPAEVAEHLDHALRIYEQVQDLRGQATVLVDLGRLRVELGDYPSALELFARAQVLSPARSDVQADALVGVAGALAALGRPADAIGSYRQALELVDGAGNRAVEGACFAGLARLCDEPGDDFERAVAAYRAGRFDFELARTLAEFGARLDQLGSPRRAEACRAEALDIARRLSPGQAEQVRLVSSPRSDGQR